MVNPVKAFNRATGLSNVFEAKQASQTEAVRVSGQAEASVPGSSAPPPQAPPLVGAEAAPKKTSKAPRQFAPAIIGSASADSGTGSKTLLGQ